MLVVRPDAPSHQMAVHFDLVPAYDLVISLAAAAQPRLYELSAAWARDVRHALPTPLRRELTHFFGDPMPFGTGPIQAIPSFQSGDAGAFIVALEEMHEGEFLAALFSRVSGSPDLQSVLRRVSKRRVLSEADEKLVCKSVAPLKAETRRRFLDALAHPGTTQHRYVALLREYHERWFARDYPATVPLLEQRVKAGRRWVSKLPAKELIARVTGGFTLLSPAARSVTLIPSYYAAPFVFVVRDGQDVVLVYGARPPKVRGAADVDIQTLRVLRSLADETRLRILHMLIERPLYGQQIAERLGLTHPTVSHHMAQLRIAGLTRTELAQDGSKTYSVCPETVEHLCTELRRAFVVFPDSSAGEREIASGVRSLGMPQQTGGKR
ncbi:MAG: hypothetical protein NVSMB52_13650 [Chloroflexota bacterium]